MASYHLCHVLLVRSKAQVLPRLMERGSHKDTSTRRPESLRSHPRACPLWFSLSLPHAKCIYASPSIPSHLVRASPQVQWGSGVDRTAGAPLPSICGTVNPQPSQHTMVGEASDNHCRHSGSKQEKRKVKRSHQSKAAVKSSLGSVGSSLVRFQTWG